MPIVKGFGAAVKANMDFGQQLSSTGAVSGATAAEINKLKQQALDLGKATKYSALEVAQGQEELLKAGRNLNQVFDEMDDTLNLATAGTLEVGRAAEIGSNMVNMFANEGIKMSEVADLMAGTANASAIDVEKLASAKRFGTSMGRQVPFVNPMSLGQGPSRAAAQFDNEQDALIKSVIEAATLSGLT